MTGVFHHIYFLPWLGYFTKLEYAHYLVVLDDVAFRRNYIKRVKILNSQGNEHWLCIPVGNNWGVSCDKIKIPNNNKFLDKHINTLRYSYGNAKFFDETICFFEDIYKKILLKEKFLVDININLLIEIRNFLELKPIKIIKTSSFEHINDKTERILYISRKLEINKIVMGNGKMKSLHDINSLTNNNIELFIQDFKNNIIMYNQVQIERMNGRFVKGLSILDALFNIGKEETRKIILDPNFKPLRL